MSKVKVCKECCEEFTQPPTYRGLVCNTCKALLKRYGINRIQKQDMIQELDNTCPGCEREFDTGHGMAATPVVDHCHDTGAVRGILCNECNLALGNVRDSVHTLANLIKYLN